MVKRGFWIPSNIDIKYTGAEENEQKTNQPVIIEEKGLKIAFLAFNDRDVVPSSYGAGINRAGTALMDVGKMTDAVKKARLQADLVIVSMHSGNEYTEIINSSQSVFAHAAIDAGAELVIGHHPHVVQRIEKYQGKYIFYSLGNFVFDQMWSEDTRQGIAVKIYLGKEGMKKAEITPIIIENYSQPNILSGDKANKVLKRLKVTGDEKIIFKN
ncbi:MAG: Capsule synthesis protein, CapA [Candidatus Falkowbacteria bacterium GW2011_GWF2_39_8]|uniref:Capsule synthesis protein, CapA n=1 Tax=Candidatus Falkowbacteria bacterium GW2011_GWF2_39_8 TaxID=1618642 RepID=A0A0G0Q109_9BACT|nr:MAG: Capsule synthesis protein, CapA [Candidatus Falkowbacteria bacterium GW2011_GWF2_39_8]